MKPTTNSYRAYIRELIPADWYQTLKKFRCLTHFITTTYNKCCSNELTAYNRSTQGSKKAYNIRMLLKNNAWYMAFIRSFLPQRFDEIMSYKNDITDSWR